MPLKVQITHPSRLTINGFTRTYQAGDVVTIGRQMAVRLMQLNKATLCDMQIKSVPLPTSPQPVAIVHDSPGDFPLPHDHVLVWDGTIPLSRKMMEAGFGLLKRWEVAVPLCDYSILAAHIGDQKDRERTEAVIRDLRVPVYETGLMFVRQCEATAELMMQWKRENGGGDPRLAFLRALYQVKPLVLALPHIWVSGEDAK